MLSVWKRDYCAVQADTRPTGLLPGVLPATAGGSYGLIQFLRLKDGVQPVQLQELAGWAILARFPPGFPVEGGSTHTLFSVARQVFCIFVRH